MILAILPDLTGGVTTHSDLLWVDMFASSMEKLPAREEARKVLEPFEWWTKNGLSMFLLVENLEVKEGIIKDIFEELFGGVEGGLIALIP